MKPEQIGAFRTPSDPHLHPDGVRVAFVASLLDLEGDRYERRLLLWDGAETRPLTTGFTDSRPRWSPDGDRIAFLRSTPDDPKRSQVCVLRLDDGSVETCSDFAISAKEAEWSPDGSHLAVVAVDWAFGWEDLSTDERKRRPARLTRATWRVDNEGSWHDRRSHVYLVEPGAGEPVLLTPGEFNEVGVAWHPSGDHVAFLGARHPGRGLDPGNQPWEVGIGGGPPRPLAGVGMWEWVGYRPDGVPHLIGLQDRWAYPDVPSLFRVDGATLTDLTGHLDRSPLPRAPEVSPAGPQWVEGGLVTVLEDSGRIGVIRLGDDESVESLIGGDRVVTGVSARPDGSALAFVAGDPTDPGELWWWEEGAERRLTDLNGEFRAAVPLVAPEAFSVTGDGGEIEAWAYLPPGDGPVPLLLNIHGGPAAQYGFGFFDEFQVYARAGYGVIACNPRGSSGRGREFLRSIVGRWVEESPPDLRDLAAVVEEALVRFPRLDGERRGVMGGSYGGFATARLIALDSRYRSAIVERALTSWHSFTGTSDIGPYFGRLYLGVTGSGGDGALWRASPMAFAHRIATPTLVLHSESDFRCPIEQGEQFFTALQMSGVPSEMLRFPDEGHELSRSGRPRHRVERLEAVLDWHARHLDGG